MVAVEACLHAQTTVPRHCRTVPAAETRLLKHSKKVTNDKKVVTIDEYTVKTNLSINKIENSFLDPASLSIWKIPNFIN